MRELEEGGIRLVSIRSPHRSEGRSGCPKRRRRRKEFQSAPPTEVRGDVAIGEDQGNITRFQSAPPTEVRGDVLAGIRIVTGMLAFQSAPPTEVRGDLSTGKQRRKTTKVSIRSPHRSEGD